MSHCNLPPFLNSIKLKPFFAVVLVLWLFYNYLYFFWEWRIVELLGVQIYYCGHKKNKLKKKVTRLDIQLKIFLQGMDFKRALQKNSFKQRTSKMIMSTKGIYIYILARLTQCSRAVNFQIISQVRTIQIKFTARELPNQSSRFQIISLSTNNPNHVTKYEQSKSYYLSTNNPDQSSRAVNFQIIYFF